MIHFKLSNPHADEEQVLFLRGHWMLLLPTVVGFVIILALPPAVWFGLHMSNPAFFATPGMETLYILGASIFFLYAWLFLFQSFIDYFLDMWLITSHRIVDVQQHGLFGRTTSELMLENVQDVTSEVKGFLHTILDYGTLYIQTAGERERFTFEDAPHPTRLAQRIMALANTRRECLKKEEKTPRE